LVREYDHLYKAINEINNLIQTQDLKNSNFYEDYLLKKVSMGELSNKKQAEVIIEIKNENQLLLERIDSLSRANIDFESKLKFLNEIEINSKENLNLELQKAKNTIHENQNQIIKLEKLNKASFENLNQMEINLSHAENEFKIKFKKIEEKNKLLKERLEHKEEMLMSVNSKLMQKSKESNEYKNKLNHYRKDFNKVRQINKSYESTIDCLKMDNQKIKEGMDKLKSKYSKIKDALENIMEEIQKTQNSSKVIRKLINEFSENKMNDSFIENVSLDSISQETLNINKSIKMIGNEFQNEETQYKHFPEFEDEIEEFTKPDFQKLIIPKKIFNQSKKSKETGISKSINQQVSGINVIFDEQKQIRNTSVKNKLNLSKQSIEKIKLDAKEKIETKIYNRSIKNQNKSCFMSNSYKSYSSVFHIEDKAEYEKYKLQFKKDISETIFSEINKIDFEFLNEKDKENFTSAWIYLNDCSLFISWIFKYFENKLKNINFKLLNIESENGKNFSFI
jgi:hypothetical protein